jgi:Propionate catabolism activator
MKEIAIIAPIASISEVAHRVVAENGYGNVDIVAGTHNLWKGVEAARCAIDEGAKVLVSRGGTYDLIKSEFDIPVVEIKVTAFDLIDSFKVAKEAGETGVVGVIGSDGIDSGLF